MTLSRSRAELGRNIKDITGHLEELQQRGMYMEAAKVRDELARLKSSFRDEESQKWIHRHTRSLGKLPLNERAVKRQIEASWKEAAEEHAAKMRQTTQEMAERQEAEVVLFRDAILREQRSKAPKFSPALIQMQEMEKTLAKTHQYEAAKKLRAEIEKNVKRELLELDQRLLDRAEARIRRLRAQHRREREILVEKSAMVLDHMMARRDKELEMTKVRFRAATHELEHALSLQIASNRKGAASVKEAALGASRRGEAVAAAAATFTGKAGGGERGAGRRRRRRQRRPVTAPGGKRNGGKASSLRPLRRRGQSARPQLGGSSDRPGTADYSRPGTAGTLGSMREEEEGAGEGWERAGERPTGTRRQRGGGKRRATTRRGKGAKAQTCDWCSGRGGYMASHGGVRIPRESANGGVGKFCTWECAKSWNCRYTPVMQRWVRNMFLDDVAGYMVMESARRHVEKKLSMRG